MPVLWPELIAEWGLSAAETDYINRQQGLACQTCANNLRSMTLAQAILNFAQFNGTLQQFVASRPTLKLLELNEAGTLHPILQDLPHHTLGTHPEVDIMSLPYTDHSYDLIVHSDTLEHVSDPLRGLRECWRVLKPGGATCYTIPVVVGRLTKKRGPQPSYHGIPGQHEYLVVSEYGSDMWTQVMEAGFGECSLTSLDYPASVAITARKAGLPPVHPKAGRLRQIGKKLAKH